MTNKDLIWWAWHRGVDAGIPDTAPPQQRPLTRAMNSVEAIMLGNIHADDLDFSLHHSYVSPGDSQRLHETQYPGYCRQAIPRNATHFMVENLVCTLLVHVMFPECTFGRGFAIHGFAVGLNDTVIYSGNLNPYIVVSEGVSPRLSAGSTIADLRGR